MKLRPKKVRVLDIEANGLLDTITKIWCFVFRSLDGKEVNAFGPTELKDAVKYLESCDVIIGHNML